MSTTAAAIDLSPIINDLLQIAGVVLVAGLGWLVQRVGAWLHVKMSAQAVASLDDAAQKAVTYGIQVSQAEIAAKGWDHPDVKNAVILAAAPYLVSRFPGALAAAGINISNPAEIDQKVDTLLDRIFPQAVAVAAASPATPPVATTQGTTP